MSPLGSTAMACGNPAPGSGVLQIGLPERSSAATNACESMPASNASTPASFGSLVPPAMTTTSPSGASTGGVELSGSAVGNVHEAPAAGTGSTAPSGASPP